MTGLNIRAIGCGRDLHALGVGPRTSSDAILGVDPAGTLRREISMPGLAAGPGGLRKALALAVGAFQSAEVAALAEPDAGHEEGHRVLLRLQGRVRATSKKSDGCNYR
jgi:hypothetical protein